MAGYLPVGAFAGLNEENACYVHVGAIAEADDHEVPTGPAEHAVWSWVATQDWYPYLNFLTVGLI